MIGFDIEAIAEALVNKEGAEGMPYDETLALCISRDDIGYAVFNEISSRWGEEKANNVMFS